MPTDAVLHNLALVLVGLLGFALLYPWVPSWALYAGTLIASLYHVVQMIRDGFTVNSAGGVVIYGTFAFLIYWGALRKKQNPPGQ